MPLDNSKLKKVYATLQQGGYKQDYKTFLKGFTGNDHYENRKKVYDLLSANGARIGSSYEEFMKKMQVAPAPAKSTPAKPKGTPITEAYRQKVLANVGNMMAETNASIQRTQNRMDYARANAGLRVPRVTIGDKNSGVRLGQNTKVVAKKPQYNPKSGKMEQTYITESGNEFTDRGAADLEQNTIDAYKDSMSVSGQLRDAYAERDRLDEAMKKRMKEIDERPNQRFNDFMRESAAAMTPGAGPAGELEARMSKYDNDDEYLQLMAAARKNHQTIQLLEDKKNNQMNSFWHSLGTTALNGYTFTDGMSEMRDATALTRASKHIDSINRKRAAGKPLTREEQTAEAVLKNFATDNAVQGMYGGDYGAWARAGGMTANSLDFMKDLMLNPGAGSMAKGIMRGTAKGMAKGLAKVTGKEAAQLWKNNVVRRTLKATGVLIGAHTAGAYVSNTTGIGRTAATMGTLASGKVGVDDNGNYMVENAMGLLPAFAEAERQQARENGSEMFGEFIPGVGGMVKKGLEKIGLSKLSGAMTNIGNKEWYKQYSRLLESGGYNGLPGEALEEYEGSLFDALTGHAGDAWDDMTNLQNHVDIWLGCATMGALLGSVPMMMHGHHTALYYRYKHNTDKADNLASFRMTAERWAPLHDKIDNTDNSKMADVVTGIINNPDLHPEEKKAALNYVRNLTMMRGYNIAQVNNASDDEEQRPEVQSVNDNYSKGYDTTEPQAMNDAKNLLDMKREQVAKEHGIENVDEVDALIGDDPLRYIEEQKQLGNTDKLQSVIDYANAKSAYDGMVQRVQDDIDSRIEETNATVDSRVNRHDGMIHPASLKLQNEDGTDKKVYIVSGNVVMFDDGKGVDREKSDNTIVIRDVETGEMKVIPPDLIRGLDAAVDPEEEKARAREAIIEEMSQTAANNVDGVVSFNEGDTYTLTDENGEQTQVTLVANEQGLVDNGDGTVNVTVDGQNVVPMSMEDIQGGVDATNMARTVQAEQERQANGENVPNSDESVQNDGENVQETPDGVEYGVNDTFTFIDGEGATIHGEVQGISDDGVEIRTDEPLNGKRVQVIPVEEFENNVESINDADGNQVWAREYAEDAAATEEVSDSTEPLDHDLVAPATPTTEELVQMARGGNELAQHQLEAQGVEWEEPAKMQQTSLSRVPINEETGEPMFEKADRETALDALNEVTGGNDENTTAIVRAQVEQATKALEALKKKEPTKKTPSLKGSPMAMVKAQQEAEANYNTAMEDYNAQVAAAEENLNAWSRINSLMNDRKRAIREQQEAERKAREEKLHAEAVARLEEDKRIAAEKAAEQEAVGTHAVNPKIKAKWDGATKVEGNPNAITLADGSTIRGHYVLTEAGAATASHDVNNAYEPTEGFPVDENGESVNDRDYKRDKDAQRIVRDMADSYDSRALQTPVIVSKDGVVLSGNNRTMSGEIAAKNGTDKAYVDHLREFGAMFGFTPEQIDGMQHPRVVFVPDEELPYDASTFARFNAEQQKKQSKPEHAVKLGKIVPDNVFTSITNDISRFDRMSDYYADDRSVASAISQLLDAGVINEMQLPELRTGNALSAAGKELIENTLIGKVFQTSPDAVRQIISTPTLRQSVVMGLNEIANNRTLAKSGYDLSKELAAAVDLVSRAKSDSPEIYKEGMPVSPYGRQQGLFDDEYGDSRVTDGVTLLLADLLNSGKPSDLRKVLSTYNNEAASPAAGQIDMFSGDVTSKEEILKNVIEYFRNATPKEQQALIDAAVAERKRRAEAAEPAGGDEASEQATVVAESDAEPQQPVVASEEPVKGNEPDADALAKEAEEKLSERITDTEDEWTEPSEYGEIYKHRMFVDGKEVIKVDAPDKSKNYPGTYYEIDGKQFGDLYEVANYIDGNEQPLSAKIEAASAEVNTDPTEAQKEAGNYKKGHVQVGTFDITIEQPQGSVRKGTDADGKQWESKMNNTYGYIRGAVGVDGDHIDVFLSNDIDGWNGRKVFVVDQYNPDGSFDEHKVMLGFNDQDEAKGDYLANYEQGWENGRRIDITGVNLEDFEKWIESSKRKTKPFGEYSSVKKDVVEINTPEETGYSITPSTYTNKKGKTSDVSLLTFDHDLTADQERAVKEFAKERTGEGRFAPARGWKDRESGGWMFRSEEDARKAAEMVGNEEAVADNQPMTAQELRDAVEPKKLTTSKKTASKKPANRVESVPTEEPIEPEKPKYEVSDEEMNGLMNDIRDILGIGDDEGDAGFKFRDPDELTVEQRQKLMSVGQRLAMAMVERGNESFGNYASMMVKALGDKVRPWLKAFYGGLEYVPGYDKYALTPYEEVKAFDVENFDKPTKDVMAQANMIVEEGKAQVAAEKANNELKATRNEQRKETEKQTAANTDAVAAEAKSVASEATALAETSSDEQALTGAAERVDETLDKVNEQLALLGYYEADEVEKDYNEAYGYMRNAEKKAVKDAANLASQLISDLNLSHYEASHSKQTDKKGNRKKKPLAVSNISPIGGDVSIHLPLEEGRELYLTIGVEPRAAKGVDGFGGSDLEVTHIMFRVDHPEGTGNDRYGRNVFVDSNVTYSDLLKQVQREAYKYLIGSGVTNEGEYAAGDKVQYSTDGGRTWTDAVVVQPNDEGGIRIDTGLAPVMWVNAHPDQLRHKPSESAEPKHEAVGDFYEDGINEDAVAALPEDTAIQLHVVDILNPGMTDHSMKSKIESLNTLLPKISDKKLSELDKEYGDDKDMGTHIKAEVARRAKDGGVQPTSSEKPADKPKPASKKNATKKVKPEQPVGDLFAGLFDNTSDNGLQGNDEAVRTETVPADNSGQQQGLRESQGSPRKTAAQEGGRPDGGRGGQSTGKDRAVSAGLHGLTEPKNTRNNHSERGADHAPTSVNGRIEANIKAIELAHELLESGETATPEQMGVLRQFSGWGGLGAAFSDGGYDWKQRERNKKIRELLGEEAYEQAVMSANSAYYTPAYVVDTLWDIANQLGFKGGNILEGSAGIGNILGQMPTTVSERSNIHAIEIDGTSGGILSLLYPDAKVEIQGFEQTRIPNGSVDLAITNVPFVTGLRVNDTTGDSDLSKKFHNIHDFCIAKNVRKLSEGGLGIFISSNGTLDNSKALRDWVVNEGGSDFIGAFRMNNKTFGGTTVTSDIIVIRKRVNGQKSAQAIDVSSISGERTAEYEEPGARKAKQLSMDYNKYFIEHPDHMAGEMRFAFEEGDTFRPTSKGLYPVSGKDQGKMLVDFVKSFTEEDSSKATTTDHHDVSLVLDASADGKKLGEMYMKDDQIVLASFGGYYPLEVNDKKIKGHTKQECFTAYAAIKSALADVMQYQTENESDAGLKPLIAKLNKAYDAFVNTYGHFNKNNQLAWLRNDVDYPNVFSLETYKEQGDGKGGVVKTYDKADVMKGRVVEKESEPHPENVKDGVVVSMFKNGRIDVPYIASQLGKSEEEAKLIDEYWKKHPGKREELKTHRDYNRFVPQVRRELEKMGYRFELDGKELTPEESLALDKQNWESRDIIPGREGHTPFVSNEDIARINAKMAGKWVGEPKEAMESAMSERVTELSERLHTPVRIIRTEEEVAALPSVRQRRMKGSFNPMTGEVTIVVPNNANMADIENTFVHEVVGHDGLRVLFPDEAKLNNALDELYRVSKDEIRGTIDRMAQKMYDAEVDRIREKKRKEHVANGEDANASYYADMAAAHAEAGKKREQFKRDATEEYGADLAGRICEKGFEKMSAEELTFWGKLKAMLQKALQKLLDGLKIPGKRKWGDKNWAFVLHEAYKRKKNGGKPTVFDAADTEVMRRKTGFGEMKFSDGKREQKSQVATTIADMKQRVTELFEKAKTGEFVGKPASIGRLSVDGKAYLEKLSDLKFKEFVDFVLNPSDLNHIRSDHYGENEKDKGNNVPLTDEDIQNMVDVLNQPDGILYGVDKKDGRKLFFFLKDAGNGLYNLTEVCSTKKGNLTAKSFFKSKKKGISQRVMEIKDSLLPTSVTYSGEFLSSDAKIPTLFEINEGYSKNVADEGIMFRDGDSVEYNKAMARDIYEQRVSRGMYQTQEALQDSMLGLKEAMDAILKAEGNGKTYIEDVAGYENAYLGENRLSSVNQAECTAFAQTLFKPMLEEVAKLAKTADERAELTDYMMAKHGLERNEVMARRAAEKDARSEFFAEVLAAQQAVDNDPLDQDAIDAFEDVKQRMQDREEELYLINRERDYAGLTALTGMDNVLDAETEAQQMVSDYERDHWVDGLWDKVNAVTKATLQKTYESGLINKATYDDISGMYENYIPLRGFDDKTSDEAYAYLTDKHSAFNAPIKTAKGRKSKADDPFANMEAMAESAIMQGNRNTLVKQKFLNFALNHPSDLVSVSDLWLWHNDVADEWQPINSGDLQGTERIEEDDSPAEVERKMRDFEYAMQQAAKNDPAHFRKQKDNPAIPYRVVESRDLRQHQVLVKRNGRDIILTINGNPRAAQALNGQTNPDNDVSGAIGAIMRLGETINRQLSAFYTTRNPDFVVSNFMRDMMYANTMVWVKESPNYAWRFHKNVAKVNPAKMKVLLAKLRNGTLDLNDETEKMFHLFMMNGGETGYANIRDIEQRKNDIKRELKKSNGQMPIRKAWDLLGERLDEYNRAVENCARFAAFMTSRQLGRTIDRSVYDAKEISVNFNKKGSGAKFWKTNGQTGIGNVAAFTSGLGRSFYVFWNAALQGSTNFGRQFKRHPKKAIAGAAAMFLLGALMASIGGGDGDDDKDDKNDYFNLPEYVRRSNVVFRLPGMDKSWISMPLPVEYRAMYGMGELMVSAMNGKEHYTAGELAHQMASQVSQMLPIDIMEGSGGFKAFVPSAIKPIAEVIGNESWTGMPIYKDTPFNKDMPEWTKAYKSANKYLVGLSKALNEATGGDAYTSGKIDINPAQVEYLLNGIFGGVSSTIDRLTKMGETVIGDREYDPRSFLLLNRLVKNGDERTEYRAVNNEYFRIKEESEKLRTRLNHYENDTADGVFDYAEKIAWLNNSPEYRILETYEDYSGDIDDINEELKAAASDEERKGLEAELNEKKKELVDAVNNIRNGKQQ